MGSPYVAANAKKRAVMLSRLDPVFRTILRRTEETDTRLHLSGRKPRSGKRKKRPRKWRIYPLAWEDTATVSVAALKAFLQTLLQGTLPEKDTPSPHFFLPERETDSVSSRAARAYRAGRAVHHPNIEAQLPPPPPAGGGAAEAVSLGSDF